MRLRFIIGPLVLILCFSGLAVAGISDDALDAAPAPEPDPVPLKPAIGVQQPEGFQWKNAVSQSMELLILQNAARFAIQAKTRKSLSGPFVKDYFDTLKQPPLGFMDEDSAGTNFVLHPIQGSTAYHIARNNGASRKQAFWWGVAYSTHFELSPLGEAGLGNVRISPVDLLVTPSAGFLLGTTEEWLLEKLSGKTGPLARFARVALVGRTLSFIIASR